MEWIEELSMIYHQQTMEHDEDQDIINIKGHDMNQFSDLSKKIKQSLFRYLKPLRNRNNIVINI